jgi:hypothetical protein
VRSRRYGQDLRLAQRTIAHVQLVESIRPLVDTAFEAHLHSLIEDKVKEAVNEHRAMIRNLQALYAHDLTRRAFMEAQSDPPKAMYRARIAGEGHVPNRQIGMDEEIASEVRRSMFQALLRVADKVRGMCLLAVDRDGSLKTY